MSNTREIPLPTTSSVQTSSVLRQKNLGIIGISSQEAVYYSKVAYIRCGLRPEYVRLATQTTVPNIYTT
jgi:hypothetical protein